MRRQNGFVLPLVLSLVAVILLLIFTGAITSISDLRNTRNDKTSSQAEYLARAGFNRYKTIAFQAFQQYLANQNAYATDASKYAQCGNLLAIGLDLNRDGKIDANDLSDGGSLSETMAVDGINGKYTIYYKVSGANIILRSIGEINDAKAIVQGVMQGQNAGALSNAIFAGKGQLGKHINGGFEVYGSVYAQGIAGQNIFDSNGNFAMRNYYTEDTLDVKLKSSNLKDGDLKKFLKAQALEQKDLCAYLRVKAGKVDLGGSGTVGQANIEGDAGNNTEMVAGVRVGSNSPLDANPIDASSLTRIHSSTTAGKFDLSPGPDYPALDSATAVDIAKLPKNVRDALGSSPTWRQTMNKDAELNGMTITVDGSKPSVLVADSANPPTCNLDLLREITKVKGNDVRTNKLIFNSQDVECYSGSPQRGFKYDYDSTTQTGTLTIKGMLNFKGADLEFMKNVIVRYENKATMFVEKLSTGTVQGGNVTIRGDVLPTQSFPDRDVLGIAAEGDLTISGEQQNIDPVKQQVVMGLFYSQQTLKLSKDSVTFGTVMGEIVDATTSASGNGGGSATVFQVPGLEYNLPPGFASLNANSTPTFAVYSYERK